MSELKRYKAKVAHKHETEENWSKSSYVPLNGEIVAYDIDETHSARRLKVGDGTTVVSKLSFVSNLGNNDRWVTVCDMAPYNPFNGMLWVDTSVISTDMISCYYNSIQDAIDETNEVTTGTVGTYTDSDGVHNVVLFSDVSSADVISIDRDCQIRLNGHRVSFTASGAKFNITNASTVIFNGTATGSEVTMNTDNGAGEKLINSPQANLVMNGGTYSMYGTYSSYCMPIDSRVDMVARNCNFIAENDYASNTRTVQITGYCTLENCSVIAKNYAQTGKSIGIYINKNSPDVKLINCEVYADGYGDINGQSIPADGVYVSSDSTLYIIGGELFGTREAIVSMPGAVVRINDSVLTGCQHGGVYVSNSDTKIKNTLIKNVNYTGTCGWPGTEYYAACYCGSDAGSTSMYFDNCRFDSEKSGLVGVAAKYTNTNVYLSNITFGDIISTDIRCDSGNTVYVGKNVTYDTTSGSGTIDTTTYADTEFTW